MNIIWIYYGPSMALFVNKYYILEVLLFYFILTIIIIAHNKFRAYMLIQVHKKTVCITYADPVKAYEKSLLKGMYF